MSKCPGLRLEIGILKVCKTNCSKFLGKVKPLQQSINDADGFKMRAACVCVKSRKEQEVRSSSFKSKIEDNDIIKNDCQVLLVTGTRGWIIPGGKVEPMEIDNPSVSAVREAREEGGVRGDEDGGGGRLCVFKLVLVPGQLGRYLGEFENTEKGHRTQVFVLYVESLDPEEQWEESIRERRWFSLQEAKEVLKTNKPNHVKYIDKMIQTKASATE